MIIRPAQQSDLVAINEIYNDEVRHSVFALDIEQKSLQERHT
jgi:L-amino acid N-acyltransferase YncA